MSVYNQSATKIVEYEDTFASTILTDFAFVAAVVLIFGLLKSAFSSYYMPVLQTNKRGWMKDIFRTSLDKYAQRGNMPLLFVIFQTLLLKTLLFVLLVAVLILFPIYASGNNQESPKSTIWKYVEISNVDTNSALMIFPAIGSIFVTIYMMQFYTEFSQIQVYYKQLVLRRSSPNNFCILIDNIPKQLRTYAKLKDALEEYYDVGEICKIIPIPINNCRLYNAYRKLSKIILKEHQISSQFYYLKAKQQYLKVKLIETNKLVYSILYKSTNTKFKEVQKKYFRLQKESSNAKNTIMKFCKAEDIDISYFNNINQLIPPFPKVVTSFKLINKNEDDTINPINIKNQQNRNFEREQNTLYEAVYEHDDRQISGCCFCVFKSQKSAAIAQQVGLLTDNLEPQIYQAPHYQDIVWRNLNSSRPINLILYLAFWCAVISVLVLFFIPQFAILRLIDSNSQEWYEAIYQFMCAKKNKCPADVKLNEGTAKQLGIECFICHKVSSMIITYIGTIVSAIFLTILPQIINFLILIPRFKTKSQRSIYKFICMFIFLFLIQGIMALFFGGATTQEGLLNVQSVLNESVEDLVDQIAKNASSQSFVFLNYVATKYFFFNILDLIRVRHIFPTIKRLLTNKDLITKSQVYNYNDYDYPTQLSYYIHMVTVGLTYMFINPVTIPVICVALLTMIAVGRYNILFVFRQNTASDLSGKNDIFRHALNCVFIGVILNIVTLLSYVLIIHQKYATYYLILQSIQVLYIIIIKLVSDQRFNKSKDHLNLGTFTSDTIYSNELLNKLKINDINYMINASIVSEQYLSVPANQESLQNYILTQEDVNNIAACYTNPAVALCAVYPRETDDWFVL